MSEAKRFEGEALEERRRKNQAARDYIRSLMEDESGDDENEWPLIEQFLQEHPLTTRTPLAEQEHKEAA